MSKRSVSKGGAPRHLVPWCLLLAFAWLIWPCAVMPQPADQPSVMLEIVDADLGEEIEVSISWVNTDSTFEVGGFDILFAYDTLALSFLSAEPGQLLVDCDWEYFTYRSGPDSGCTDSTCPSATVRVVGVAETNNGDDHPTCYADSSGELVSLQFLVTDDPIWECQSVPLSFFWIDCGDNVFSSKSGESLFVSRDVYDWMYLQINQDSPLPTYFGAPDSCVGALSIRMIDFYNGGIDIQCYESLGVRGDVNLNGMPNEIADWVVFSCYFYYGLDCFTIDPDVQSAATDVNADGIVLTLDDFVYLWRVIIGDALPFPKPTPPQPDTATFVQDANTKTVSISYPDSLTAVYLVFRGNIVPTSLVDSLPVGWHFDTAQGVTRVLGFPYTCPGVFFDPPPVFSPGPLLTYTGIGVLEEAYTSDYGVYPIPTEIEVLANLEAKTEVEPTPMYAFWVYAIEPVIGTAYLGNFAGPSVTDIDPSTILINDIIEPMSTQILPDRPGFTGEVMEITFSASEMVLGYLPFFDTTSLVYSVSGQFADLSSFTVFGDVAMIGHISGDVNVDGAINVADLAYLVEFLFFGGPPPRVMETADLNHSGSIEVADLILLVELIF